ncbi:MAG: peptide-methionine (S)-S-oxide reductase MsrA [Gemmataceae bacterium]|nr:peptide-methionine (S)-S-oxide reductase MsrA [Gemmataceae bacterium]
MRELATLGGGCFWCLEAVFEQLRGVDSVTSGYAGGATPNPDYKSVCTGATGHAEVVQIQFDPAQISFRELLDVFFATHDPTTLNRQGADTGTQYRSVIYFHSPEQKATAEQAIKEWNENGAWGKPIVTELTAYPEFHRAEEYHQGYFRSNPAAGYCMAVINPKVSKFRKLFADRLKTSGRGD